MDTIREKRLVKKQSMRGAGSMDSAAGPRRKYPATTLVTDNLVQWQDEYADNTSILISLV
jgi:hypothetical protein